MTTGFICGEGDFMFIADGTIPWDAESIGRLTMLAGGSKKYAMMAAGKAAIDIALGNGCSSSEAGKAANDAIFSIADGLGNVASRFRKVVTSWDDHHFLDFLFYHKDLLKEMIDESMIIAKQQLIFGMG